MIIRKCNGCGSILQEEDESKPGFVPKLTSEIEYGSIRGFLFIKNIILNDSIKLFKSVL